MITQRTNVTVGRENPNQELTSASVLVSRYDIGREKNSGMIALVGPVRINYARLIPHLEYFAQTMGKLLHRAGPAGRKRADHVKNNPFE